ncbi:MAG TPA: hypothetical protein VGV87_07020 [Blastocatellia bacterium]|jgi:hypothetical protein|nr:hypothetical protein [Blastocatellia bacterium]
MAIFNLSEHFQSFFKRLNPGPSFEGQASSQYNTIKGLIEDRLGLARELAPACFLQGSYKQQTAIDTINDVDIVALCRLWQPGGGGSGRSYGRDEIFRIIASPLLNDGRYKSKIRFDGGSMCIKVDLGIKVEILPVVYKSGNDDQSKEPFRLYRPEKALWEDGYARYHQQWLTWKNRADKTVGNFIPAIKVLKHLRSYCGLDGVSFHIECLLFSLPDSVFLGAPADWIERVLSHIAGTPAATWYSRILPTPCSDGRDIFSDSEWKRSSWETFHRAVAVWASGAGNANRSSQRDYAIKFWQIVLGDEYFPARAS